MQGGTRHSSPSDTIFFFFLFFFFLVLFFGFMDGPHSLACFVGSAYVCPTPGARDVPSASVPWYLERHARLYKSALA